MYKTAIKNKDKKEFDWDNNESCIDFHLIIEGEDNFYYSGSFCYEQYEFYGENNPEQETDVYDYSEFERESIKAVKQFLNRKNKKEYKVDEPLEVLKIKLWNNDSESQDTVMMHTQLTYCP